MGDIKSKIPAKGKDSKNYQPRTKRCVPPAPRR